MKYERQKSIFGSYWTLPVLTAFQIQDNRHWPDLHGLLSPLKAPIQESHDHLMMHSRLTLSLKKAATDTRLMTLKQGTQWNMVVYIEPASLAIHAFLVV